MACHVDHDVLATSLPRLPMGDPVFVIADGHRTLPPAIMSGASVALHAAFHTLDSIDAQLLAGLSNAQERMAVGFAVCAEAESLLLNNYSPLSHSLEDRALERAEATGRAPPRVMHYTRKDSDMCIPIFTRTARFDIQPNRYGILGQFGPDRKLQLVSTNLSSIVGWNGKLMANASVELEVYVSNRSHALHIFEYTKENNAKGVQFALPTPLGGWKANVWHSFSVPIHDSNYYFPASTPWDSMDRLELYYMSPSPHQVRGEFIRIRNVFVRSTQFAKSTEARNSRKGKASKKLIWRPCREIDLTAKLSKLRPHLTPAPSALETLPGSDRAAQRASNLHTDAATIATQGELMAPAAAIAPGWRASPPLLLLLSCAVLAVVSLMLGGLLWLCRRRTDTVPLDKSRSDDGGSGDVSRGSAIERPVQTHEVTASAAAAASDDSVERPRPRSPRTMIGLSGAQASAPVRGGQMVGRRATATVRSDDNV